MTADNTIESDEARKIREYGETLGLFFPMTVDNLIRSHTVLRAKSLAANEERAAEMEQARAFARQEYEKLTENGKFISLVQLRTMTLIEIVELINTNHFGVEQ